MATVGFKGLSLVELRRGTPKSESSSWSRAYRVERVEQSTNSIKSPFCTIFFTLPRRLYSESGTKAQKSFSLLQNHPKQHLAYPGHASLPSSSTFHGL